MLRPEDGASPELPAQIDSVQSALNLFANGAGVQKHGEKQRGGFILPEVTVVEIGAEIY